MIRHQVTLVALAALIGGCSTDSGERESSEIAIFAASSLTEALGAVAEAFESANPDLRVRLTFAGSQALRIQLEQGARADLFASANEGHVAALLRAGVATRSHVFARNGLAVIVPLDNPAGIESFEELGSAERLVIGTENVPVGAYTREMLARAEQHLGAAFGERVRSRVVSEEGNVRLVRAKVELGEADAAIVYRTDARSSERVRMVPIPEPLNPSARYSIAVVGPASPRVDRFLAFLDSASGRTILEGHGFDVDDQ